jgi:hypothetical protein
MCNHCPETETRVDRPARTDWQEKSSSPVSPLTVTPEQKFGFYALTSAFSETTEDEVVSTDFLHDARPCSIGD